MGSSELPYLVDKPERFGEFADLILVLDDGERLPVHSCYLVAQSQVLCDIILTAKEERQLLKDSLPYQELHLPDTTYKEACDFLTAVYILNGTDTLSFDIGILPGLLKVAHKFGMQKILNVCDQRCAAMANYDNSTGFTLWVRAYYCGCMTLGIHGSVARILRNDFCSEKAPSGRGRYKH